MRQQRRGRPDRPDRAGGQPLAGRRLLHRELELARSSWTTRACWRRSTRPPWPASPRRTAPPTASGSGCRPASASSSTTAGPVRLGAARRRSWTWPSPQWKGKIELAPAETDFWPIVSSVDRAKGDAATLKWLEGLKANAGSQRQRPRQRDAGERHQQGGHRARRDQPLLLLPTRGREGEGQRPRRLAEFAPAIRAMSRTSRPPACSSPPRTRRPPRSSSGS